MQFKYIARVGMISVWVWGVLAWAQNTGSINGSVSDASGAIIPGAQVTVRNLETGLSRVLSASARGGYAALQLQPGSYEVSATAPGFQTEVRRGIELTVGREAVVNFALQVGSVAERVEVVGEAPLLETTTSTVSGLVDSRQLREIPLNARSFVELVPLQGGAVMVDTITSSSATFGFGKKLSVGGARSTSTSFLLDGADLNDASGTAGSAATTVAGVETVREFRVILNAYDAEYGRHTGGVISAVTKSGSNEIHGSIFEFFRNDNMDAARWEDNAFKKGKKPEFRRNQFGFAAGGPLRRDKAFFFGSYEGTRQALGQTISLGVPSMEMRERGVIPNVPACSQGCAISPASRPYLTAYPLPTGTSRSDGTADYATAVTETTNQDYWTGRVDWNFSASDFLFGRYTNDSAERVAPDGFTSTNIASTPNHYSTLEHTHIFSPVLLSKTHFSFNRTSNNANDVVAEGFSYPNGFFSFDGGDVPGRMTVPGLQAWGGSSTNPKRHAQNLFQFKQDFYRTSSRHSIKLGGMFERIQYNPRSDFHSGGTLIFDTREEFVSGARNSTGQFVPNTVSAASFVTPGSDNIRGWRQSLLGLYLHDDVKVRNGLTVNLGLRYEIITSPQEVNGKIANIRDFSAPRIQSVTPGTTDVGAPYFLNPSLRNFAPRVGFAWDPFGDATTSVRGGFGMFDEHLLPNSYITTGVRGAPFYSYADLFARDFPLTGIEFPRSYFTQVNIPGATLPGVRPEFRIFQWNPDRSYLMKWSLDVERQFGATLTMSVGYSGSKGVHLMRSNQSSNTTPDVIISGQRYLRIDMPLPNTSFNRIYRHITDGDSSYHGLRLNVQQRFSRGLQLQVSYTFSKSLDVSSSNQGGGEFSGQNVDGDLYGGSKWRGVSGFNIPHSFYTNFLYDLPGRNWGGTAGRVLGGWNISGILRLTSGPPAQISALTPASGSRRLQFVAGPTVNLIPGGDNNPVHENPPTHPNGGPVYFDASQFTWPANFRNTPALANVPGMGPGGAAGNLVSHGNLGRNTLVMPGVANVDFTLNKNTRVSALGEGGELQFRIEFYNLLNRVNFANPILSLFNTQGVASPTAGRITGTRIAARQLQVALKVVF